MAVVAYGVGIESSFDFDALPHLDFIEKTVSVEVRRPVEIKVNKGVWVGGGYAQRKHIQVFYYDTGPHLAYHVDEALHFELYPFSDLLVCNVASHVSDELLRYWILQQILPFQLMLGGFQEPLHGACVSLNARQNGDGVPESACVGFLGPSHAGKSTLLSYFLSRGHDLIADDVIALNTANYAEVYPALPFYRPYRAIESLGFQSKNYSPKRRPLQQLYFIEPVAADAEIRIEKMPAREVITQSILEKQFLMPGDLAPKFAHLLSDRFRGLAQLSRQVPAFRLQVPRRMDRLPEVYDFIQRDMVS